MKKLQLFGYLVLLMFFVNACGDNSFEVEQITENKTGEKVIERLGVKREVETTLTISYPKISGLRDKRFEKKINRIIKENVGQLAADDAIECTVSYEILNQPTSTSDYLSILQSTRYISAGNMNVTSMIVLNVDMKNKKIRGSKADDWSISIGHIYLMNYNMELQNPQHAMINTTGFGHNVIKFDDLKFGVKNDSIAIIYRSNIGPEAMRRYVVFPYLPANDVMDEAGVKEFDEFIERFCADEKFQFSRIKFPVGEKHISVDDFPCPENDPNYGNGPFGCYKIELLTEKNWEPITENMITPFYINEFYGYWDRKNKIAEFKSGSYLHWDYDCRFEKIKGKWYLTDCNFY